MLETALDIWLVIRLLISAVLGVRTANRLRHDETSQRAVRQMGALHLVAACVTWVLEAFIRDQNLPAVAGPVAGIILFPFMLITTVWVPIVDAVVFFLISAVISVLLVRRRLTRYREELLLGEPYQRARAADACSFLGRLGRPALPELMHVAGDPDAELRFRTARALGRVNPRDRAEPVACLRQSLVDSEKRVRLMAACALAMLGEADPPVVDGVLTALAMPDEEDLRGEGYRAIPKLGPAAGELGAERLLALTDHWKYTWGAATMLSHIGAPAVPALVVLLSHPKIRVRSAAAASLGRIGPAAELALPMLTAAVKDDGNKSVRMQAKTAIRQITHPRRWPRS
jgi:HEAT repeat protein